MFLLSLPFFECSLSEQASVPKYSKFPKEVDSFLQSVGYVLLLTPVKGKSEVCLEGVQPGRKLCSTLKCQCNNVHTLIEKKEEQLFSKTQYPKLHFSYEWERLKNLPVKFLSSATRWFGVDRSTLSAVGHSFCVYHTKPWC